ncbi:hypothetical protein OG21DRAFT_913438 [Imleria badia]|nr:hypothetical protein OG21DRAFT_913438 [Imleria badia]
MDGNEIQRNFVCFISRLPVETLEAIFMYGACDYYSKDDGHAIPTAPSWVNVSYICRHWRYITLNSPALWSNLFIASPRWTEELLARSKPAPLKLYVNLQRQDEKRGGPCFLKQVMSHLGRIQELHLHLTALHDSYQFLSKLSSPAPRLQILEITMDSCPSKWSSVPFDGETPALRTLRLWDCLVPWHSLKLSRLTTLSLSYISPIYI